MNEAGVNRKQARTLSPQSVTFELIAYKSCGERCKNADLVVPFHVGAAALLGAEKVHPHTHTPHKSKEEGASSHFF